MLYRQGMRLPTAAEALYVPAPPGGNAGDTLIDAGVRRFLASTGLDTAQCDGSLSAAALVGDTGYLEACLGGFTGLLLFCGGGNIGVYPENELVRRSIIGSAPGARASLVFPQSGPRVESALIDDSVTVWARDAVSHRMFESAGVRSALVPDSALLMADTFPEAPGGSGTLWILRRPGTCLERVEHQITVDGPVVDLTLDFPLGEIPHRMTPYRWVVSDRLHGGIIAMLMRKRVALLPVAYHKNRAFYDTWLADDPGVAFVTSDDQLSRFRSEDTPPPGRGLVDRAWQITFDEFRRFLDRSARGSTRRPSGGLRDVPRSEGERTMNRRGAEEVVVGLPRVIPDGPGRARLEATITVPAGAVDVWFSVPESAVPSDSTSDPFALAALLPAMRTGSPLVVEGSVSDRLLRNLEQLQRVYAAWFPEFDAVPLAAGAREASVTHAGRGGAFFSGGVDSFYTVISRRQELDFLVYVDGLDMIDPDPGFRAMVADRIRGASEELGLRLVEVRTNVREFSDPYARWADHYHSIALGAVGHALAGMASELFISADHSYSTVGPWGVHPLTTPMFSSDRTRFTASGWEIPRVDRVAVIAESPVAMRYLRVCWENRRGAYNCGECEKCLRTKTALILAGALEKCTTLDTEIDFARYEAIGMTPLAAAYVVTMHQRALERGHTEIAAVLGRMIDRYGHEIAVKEAQDSFAALLARGDDGAGLVAAHRDAIYAALTAHHGRWLVARVLRDLPRKARARLFRRGRAHGSSR